MASGKTSRNLTWHGGLVSAERRAELLGQRGCVVWLTGFSGSGKSTLARALENRLIADHRAAYVLDGDNLRHGLNRDLGFSPEDRDENIRRVGEVAALMADAGLITITAFISPYRAARQRAREAAGATPFIEVFLDVPIEVCRQRDPKGLYAKAQAGKLDQFTGIDAPYEPPEKAEVVIDTAHTSVQDCVEVLCGHLVERGVLRESEGRGQRSEIRDQKSETGKTADLCPLTSDPRPLRTPLPGTPSPSACPPSPRRGEGKGRGKGKDKDGDSD